VEREVLSFIRMHGIKAAENPIPFTLIFEFYKTKHPKSHVGKRKFGEAFNKHFTPNRNGRGIFYKLDPVAFGREPTYSMYSDTRYYPAYTGRQGRYAKKAKAKTEE
jgi:hypothetical protein